MQKLEYFTNQQLVTVEDEDVENTEQKTRNYKEVF